MSDGVIGERIVGERRGSLRRWRWVLLVVMVVLLVARFATSVFWMSRSPVIGGGGPPAILRTSSFIHRTLEAWDWNTGRMELIATINNDSISGEVLCTGDGKVVWFTNGVLHTVELKPPHARQEIKPPFPTDEAHWFKVLGTSTNSRFVALEYTRVDKTTPRRLWESAELAVIDLQTGEVISNKHWHSRTESTFIVGEFNSRRVTRNGADPNEPDTARWRLTDQGAWELLPAKANPEPRVSIVVDQAGNRRRLLEGEKPKNQEEYDHPSTKALSPGGEHVLMHREGQLLLLAHEGSHDVQVLPITSYYTRKAVFTVDGKHLLVADIYSDVHVFDAATGRILASTRSGWTWFCAVVACSAAWLGVALIWLRLAFRQTEPLRTIIDLHAAGIACQIAQFGLLGDLPLMLPVWLRPATEGSLAAIIAVFGISVGWYWTYGRASVGGKLKYGLLSVLAIAVVPAVVSAMYGPRSYLVPRLVMPAFATLFAASVMALMLVPLTLFPWRASDQPLQSQPRRFGLASMMLLIAGVAVVLGFLNLILMESSREGAAGAAMFLLPVAAIGLLWPAIAMMNIGRGWRIAIGVGVAASVVGAMTIRSSQQSSNSWHIDYAAYGFAATTAPLILGMAILARRYGWRWRKAQASTGEVPSLEAAA